MTSGFSFKYPQGWTVRQDENPRALLEIYDPETTQNLQSCLQKTASNNQLADCGQQESDYQIFLFPDAYVDYGSLDSWIKTNYPDYKKVDISGLDIFSYTGGNDNPAEFYYHINTPDKQSGLYFEAFPNGNETQNDQTILSQIIQTFSFSQNQVPPFSQAQLSVKYNNTQYGFTFSLPADWKGYSVYTKQWTGNPLPGSSYAQNISGPEIYIRNPNWTAQNAYEDIPVMVFTPAEWAEIQKQTLAVSAAPIGPTELGSNQNYVFALPPRYDYDYKTGWQEVEKIMASNPLSGN
jgi:hypothetical protein